MMMMMMMMMIIIIIIIIHGIVYTLQLNTVMSSLLLSARSGKPVNHLIFS